MLILTLHIFLLSILSLETPHDVTNTLQALWIYLPQMQNAFGHEGSHVPNESYTFHHIHFHIRLSSQGFLTKIPDQMLSTTVHYQSAFQETIRLFDKSQN